jgi:hypothetical protein
MTCIVQAQEAAPQPPHKVFCDELCAGARDFTFDPEGQGAGARHFILSYLFKKLFEMKWSISKWIFST